MIYSEWWYYCKAAYTLFRALYCVWVIVYNHRQSSRAGCLEGNYLQQLAKITGQKRSRDGSGEEGTEAGRLKLDENKSDIVAVKQ